jgi:hypothetical protein
VASKDLEQALLGLAPVSQGPTKAARDEAQKRLDKAEASIDAYAARMGERLESSAKGLLNRDLVPLRRAATVPPFAAAVGVRPSMRESPACQS